MDLVADGHERARDREAGGVEVDVAPPQSEHFAAAHAGVRSDPQRRVGSVGAGRGQKRPQLLGVPHARGVGRQRSALRCVGDLQRVGEQEAAPHGVVERSSQDHVDLHNGLVLEPTGAVGATVIEELGVEAFEMTGTEVPQGDTTDVRDHVQVDDPPIGVVGTDPERELLRWQPTLRREHSQREAAALMTVPAPAVGELLRDLLRSGTVGAGGMPPPSLAPGDRIDALIDHRVEAITLACHLALHDILRSRGRHGASR